ncbi:MAG TPA: metallophosphoesterase [Stellaceae bacterium]|nr:metallophosphoesterase [Stellaceae bacterium]
MNLWAISDLHLSDRANRQFLRTVQAHPDDWLILAGDICDTEEQLADAFAFLRRRFARLIWVPGNHELWTTSNLPGAPDAASGEARYDALVALARAFGVLTPEDPYPLWPGSGRPIAIAPLFMLYDYSFRPDDVAAADVVDWAATEGVVCADEMLLGAAPYGDRAAWCATRVGEAAARLAALPADYATVLINHYPLEPAHATLPSIPRFAPWCGTRLTAGWHRRFRAVAVVYGHLHVRRSFDEDGVQFHEVSLGYPGQWEPSATIDSYLRRIL